MNEPQVTTSRTDVRTHSVERWHALVEWYVRVGDGTYFTGWEQCQHDHLDERSAEKCKGRLMYRIEHNPHLFPSIVKALEQARTSANPDDAVEVETR